MSDDEIDPASGPALAPVDAATGPDIAEADLAREIRERREAAGLSQGELAIRVGYSRQYVAAAERPHKGFAPAPLVAAIDRELGADGDLTALRARLYRQRVTRRTPLPEPPTPTAAEMEALTSDWPATVEQARRAAMVLLTHASTSAATSPAEEGSTRTAALRWLTSPPDAVAARTQGRRRVGRGDVSRIRSVRQQLKALDDAHGGGTAFPMTLSYLRDQVMPLLRKSYDGSTGRDLLEATAELALDVGWMSYDDGTDQRLARHYLLVALRLAHAAGNRLLGGRILCALSHHALHLGEVPLAVDLVRTARTGAAGTTPAKVTAMLAAMEACAHAAGHDVASCTSSLRDAENALAHTHSEDGPEWLDFDEGGLWGHAARAHRDLARAASGTTKTRTAKAAQRYAAQSIALCRPDHGRTRAQRNAILADACLQLGDVEQAATVGTRILADAWNVQSTHVYAEVAALAAGINAASVPAPDFLDPAAELLATTRPHGPAPTG